MNNGDLEFLYDIRVMIGKHDFIRLIDIVTNCECRHSNLSACNLDCSKCIYEELVKYVEEMNK